jgi:hypothetical protein
VAFENGQELAAFGLPEPRGLDIVWDADNSLLRLVVGGGEHPLAVRAKERQHKMSDGFGRSCRSFARDSMGRLQATKRDHRVVCRALKDGLAGTARLWETESGATTARLWESQERPFWLHHREQNFWSIRVLVHRSEAPRCGLTSLSFTVTTGT